jgi:hypothetical protein
MPCDSECSSKIGWLLRWAPVYKWSKRSSHPNFYALGLTTPKNWRSIIFFRIKWPFEG